MDSDSLEKPGQQLCVVAGETGADGQRILRATLGPHPLEYPVLPSLPTRLHYYATVTRRSKQKDGTPALWVCEIPKDDSHEATHCYETIVFSLNPQQLISRREKVDRALYGQPYPSASIWRPHPQVG